MLCYSHMQRPSEAYTKASANKPGSLILIFRTAFSVENDNISRNFQHLQILLFMFSSDFSSFILMNDFCFYLQLAPLIYQNTYLINCKYLNLPVSLAAGLEWELDTLTYLRWDCYVFYLFKLFTIS